MQDGTPEGRLQTDKLRAQGLEARGPPDQRISIRNLSGAALCPFHLSRMVSTGQQCVPWV